jgi:hypothetical protein
MEVLLMMSKRFTIAALLSLWFTHVCAAQADHATVAKNFVGTWKENEAKRKLGSFASLRFQRGANGELQERRGPEARPLIQPVKFGSEPYSVDNSKNTILWKKTDESHYERQLFEGGKLITTRQISISKDGKTLTEVTRRKSADGKDVTTTVALTRSSGEQQGLVGTWKAESVRSSDPSQEKIEPAGKDVLRLTGNFGVVRIWNLDGKPNVVTGPAVISGTSAAAKTIDANTIEETSTREGVVTARSRYVLSNGGKTLTITSTAEGTTAGREPSVIVMERQ